MAKTKRKSPYAGQTALAKKVGGHATRISELERRVEPLQTRVNAARLAKKVQVQAGRLLQLERRVRALEAMVVT